MPGLHLELSSSGSGGTTDRPESRHTIAPGTTDELETAIVSLGRESVHAGVSGGDLLALSVLRVFDDAQRMARGMRAVLDALARLPMPVVAAVNGHAFGGWEEVAVACDFRVAADDVPIAFNQARLGLTPAWGGIEPLVALVGRVRAGNLIKAGCASRAGRDAELRVRPHSGIGGALGGRLPGCQAAPSAVSFFRR